MHVWEGEGGQEIGSLFTLIVAFTCSSGGFLTIWLLDAGWERGDESRGGERNGDKDGDLMFWDVWWSDAFSHRSRSRGAPLS